MSGLTNILTNSASTARKKTPNSNILTSFLDKDGDGSIIDDIGGSILKSIFKR